MITNIYNNIKKLFRKNKTPKTYTGLIDTLEDNQIFVFGSNPEGQHGGGAAKVAHQKFEAEYSKGRGLTGQCYALPTKNLTAGYWEKETGIEYAHAGFRSIPISMIVDNIADLYGVAELNPDKEFLIAYTMEGTLLNGYNVFEMAYMFAIASNCSENGIPENIIFEDKFQDLVYHQLCLLEYS